MLKGPLTKPRRGTAAPALPLRPSALAPAGSCCLAWLSLHRAGPKHKHQQCQARHKSPNTRKRSHPLWEVRSCCLHAVQWLEGTGANGSEQSSPSSAPRGYGLHPPLLHPHSLACPNALLESPGTASRCRICSCNLVFC